MVKQELTHWLENQGLRPGFIDRAVQVADRVVHKVAAAVLQDGRVSLRFGWAAVQMHYVTTPTGCTNWCSTAYNPCSPRNSRIRRSRLGNLKPLLRQAFMAELDALDEQIREAALLRDSGWHAD